jgi:hypothetical protein
MKNNNELTVYWAPASYFIDEESWGTLYRDPLPLFSSMRKYKTNVINSMFSCPAMKDSFNNVFAITSAIDDTHILPSEYLIETNDLESNKEPEVINTGGKVGLLKVRKTSLNNYSNLIYNMKWMFFSEEPVLAKFTAPYFPPTTPAKGAILASGKFDIGQWPRMISLDYHIPLDVKTFEFKENDHIFYVHIETDRPINLKRITMSKPLYSLFSESAASSSRYGIFKPLSERYRMAKEAKIKEQVLREIKKNLIEG